MNLDIKCAMNVFIRKGKAFVVPEAITDEGQLIAVAPVYTIDLSWNGLTDAMINIFQFGSPRISKKEINRLPDVILEASGVKSWKELTKGGAAYGIAWVSNKIYLSMSIPGSKFEWDINRRKEYPIDTDIKEIARSRRMHILGRRFSNDYSIVLFREIVS